MKKKLLCFFISFLSLHLCAQETGDTIISNNPQNFKVIVSYFHITHRCQTCYSIEKQVRKTIFENFKNELDSGIVALQIINCELPENQAIKEKYQAYGATLALTSLKNNVEEIKDISNFAFSEISNPDIFREELSKIIINYLKE